MRASLRAERENGALYATMDITNRILARSNNYIVLHEYEVALLERPIGPRVVIGDFYGDPTAAVIDWKEKWCVIAGRGLILYWLREPFENYEYNKETDQWWEVHRSPPEEWWIEALYQIDDNIVRFVVDPYGNFSGLYELRIDSLSIARLIPNEGSV